MKKILFVIPSLHNGGTVTTLKNTLPYIDREQCQIDVFPITNSGPNYNYVSKYANVLGGRVEGADNVDFRQRIKNIIFLIVRGAKKILCRLGYDPSSFIFKRVVATLQKNEYDEVIAFQEVQATRLVQFFRGAHKVAWVHCDYSKIDQHTIQTDIKNKTYDKFDKIVCVSRFTRSQFVKSIEGIDDKTVAIHNLISSDVIKNQSTQEVDDSTFINTKCKRFVSIGRLHPVKRFSMIPNIAKRLRDRGLSFVWFIIGGDDSDKETIENNIVDSGVQDCVKLLGNKNNPYPYIAQADALICTSLSEACPNVLNEAKILGTPIVSTDYGSVDEMMTNGVEGLISPIESIESAIFRLITDEELYERVKQNLSHFKYDNSLILKMLSNETMLRFNDCD